MPHYFLLDLPALPPWPPPFKIFSAFKALVVTQYAPQFIPPSQPLTQVFHELYPLPFGPLDSLQRWWHDSKLSPR